MPVFFGEGLVDINISVGSVGYVLAPVIDVYRHVVGLCLERVAL